MILKELYFHIGNLFLEICFVDLLKFVIENEEIRLVSYVTLSCILRYNEPVNFIGQCMTFTHIKKFLNLT